MYWIIDTQHHTYITNAAEQHKSLFLKDNWLYETHDFVSYSKGVLLNANLLMQENLANTNLFHALFEKYGNKFPAKLVGSFCGVYYHKARKKWVVFTNHSGDQKVFYAQWKSELLISDSVFELNTLLLQRGIKPTINRNAAYAILTYGYLFNQDTLLQEVYRLTAGTLLEVEDEKVQVKTYYQLQNEPSQNVSLKEAVDELDFRFRKAVELEYAKDAQYGLHHIASMSGGLDSRMTGWVADDLGFKNHLFCTFSQTGYEDMRTAESIAQTLKTPWKFIPLDGGDYLKEVEYVVEKSNGLVAYASSATAYTSHNQLDWKGYGLLHTGQLGDVIIGSYCTPVDAYGNGFDFQSKALSKRFLHKVQFSTHAYANTEMAYMYNRGFNGILCGNFSLQGQTEVTSPFIHPDVMNFAFSLPIEMRSHHKLYKQWIIQKYPKAAQFKWEAIHAKITTPVFRYKQFQMPYHKLPFTLLKRSLRKLGVTYLDKKTALDNMTPFERWHLENPSLSTFVNDYVIWHIDLLEDTELKQDCLHMVRFGSFSEQLQVLTLLAFSKKIRE